MCVCVSVYQGFSCEKCGKQLAPVWNSTLRVVQACIPCHSDTGVPCNGLFPGCKGRCVWPPKQQQQHHEKCLFVWLLARRALVVARSPRSFPVSLTYLGHGTCKNTTIQHIFDNVTNITTLEGTCECDMYWVTDPNPYSPTYGYICRYDTTWRGNCFKMICCQRAKFYSLLLFSAALFTRV